MNQENEKDEFYLKEETGRIIACALEVSHVLGCGLKEKIYENSLCIEMTLRNIPFVQQQSFDIQYKGTHVGSYQPDLLVYGQIVVETKNVESIGEEEIAQTLTYMRITGYKVGLILNFKHLRLECKRVTLQEQKGKETHA